MSITDGNKIKEHTQLGQSASDKLAAFVSQAETRLRFLIGDDKYATIAGDTEHKDYEDLSRAASYVTVYYGLQFLNLRPTELGGFTKMVGYGESPTEMLMGERELRAIRGRMYEMAIELLDGIRDIVPEDPNEFENADIDSFDAGPFMIG